MTDIFGPAISSYPARSGAASTITRRVAVLVRLLRRRAGRRAALRDPYSVLDARLLVDIGLNVPQGHRDRWIEMFILHWR
jgi:hypothetical protein